MNALARINTFLSKEKAAQKSILPAQKDIFRAFQLTPLNQVKVVIVGQDPYPGAGQANGLCFSVNKGIKIPPSLKNIYKELEANCGIPPASHGCLVAWAKQGVLLLNSILTVEMGHIASHRGQGWEQFTDRVIAFLNNRPDHKPLVFVLWGEYAQQKGKQIDESKHLVIRSSHPSPLSAHRGFLGSRPFSQINQFLKIHDQTPIDWRLDEIPTQGE